MLKVLKVSNTVLYYEQKIKGYVEGVKSVVCSFYTTLYTE